MRIAPSDGSYKTFSEMVAGYRFLSVVRHAVHLGIIEAVGAAGGPAEEIIAKSGIMQAEGERFLALLVNLGVLEKYQDLFHLSQFSRKYLAKESGLSQLHVLEFEQTLVEKWAELDTVLRQGQGVLQTSRPESEYQSRLRLFQKAMHEAALVRSEELWDALSYLPSEGTIIDVGAGDGSYLKAFLKRFPNWQGVACDLADVLDLEGSFAAVPGLTGYPCNILDEGETARFVAAFGGKGSLLLLSNVLHCYGEADNVQILGRLKDLVQAGGMVVVHDFFTDANAFGATYDGHMLANTYNGRTYTMDETKRLLCGAGFGHAQELLLPSASCAIVASRKPLDLANLEVLPLLQRDSFCLGFTEARPVDLTQIRVEPWVKAKCSYGCAMFGKKWSCPPHSLDEVAFRELLGCYGKALLVVGQPPLRDFQGRLLELEKAAFLKGHKKALVFSAGPCSWCESCPAERCRFPGKRRPSLESCGCDVFELAATCGITIQPVRRKEDFVQYAGLLLVE